MSNRLKTSSSCLELMDVLQYEKEKGSFRMNLEALYDKVRKTIALLDFNRIWPGFEPLKFALYDDKRCFFDGQFIEKTDEFCANTSIKYHGEQIAIWMVRQEMDISVLTSKIVHEMFHGFQNLMGWDCGPNELEALYRYRYDVENLSVKLYENELLLALLDRFDASALQELLACRKRRQMDYPYEFLYESKVEEIEGTANYVEWQALEQLDESKAHALTEHMRTLMTKPESLFPIRISSYYTGALMINALRGAGRYCFEAAARPAVISVLTDISPSEGDFPGKADLVCRTADAAEAFHEETGAIIRAALEKNQLVLNGPLELTGLNVYNARCRDGFLTTTYFLMYKQGNEDKMLQGNFVIKMQDEKMMAAVYRWA